MKSSYFLVVILSLTLLSCAQKKSNKEMLFNAGASLPDSFALDPTDWKVIGSTINKSTHTMSTLYGNDVAVTYARTNAAHVYPNGAEFSRVTWSQKEDEHWFGGNIPSSVLSVELLRFDTGATAGSQLSYTLYEGTPLTKITQPVVEQQKRIDQIVNQKASIMP